MASLDPHHRKPLFSYLRTRAAAAIFVIAAAWGAMSTAPVLAASSTAPYSETATISSGTIGSLAQVAVDPVLDRIYAESTSGILAIDGQTNAVIATIPVPHPNNITVNPVMAINTVTHTVYATDGDAAMYVIDESTDAITHTVPVDSYLGGLAVDSATNTIFTSSLVHQQVTIIDGSTFATVASLPGGGGSIAVNSLTDTIYALDAGYFPQRPAPQALTVIDGAHARVSATIGFSSGTGNGRVAVDESTNLIYVSLNGASDIAVIDGTTNTITSNLTIPSPGYSFAIDPSSNTGFMSTLANGMTAFDLATATVISNVNFGRTDASVAEIAVSPVTHLVYAAEQLAQGASGQVSVVSNSPISPSTTVNAPVENPVYRFYGPKSNDHFYTMSAEEKDEIIANYPPRTWTYEGVAYNAFATQAPGTVPLYRFWSPRLSGHFYTASATEKDSVIANYPASTWTYEGIAYYVYPANSTLIGTTPVARFWSSEWGQHFYTASEAESAEIQRNYPSYVWAYEGINFFVPSN